MKLDSSSNDVLPAPWEKDVLPEGAVGKISLSVFIYDGEPLASTAVERIVDAYRSFLTNIEIVKGACKRDQPVGVRQGLKDDVTGKTKYEWYFKPIPE